MSEFAQAFRAMVARIEKMDPADFAGAVVIVPPGDGEPIVELRADPNPDVVGFWAGIETRIETRKMEMARAEQDATTFGRR